MFSIGDRIVYPMHGAGIIEGIEKKKILGKLGEYYILKVPFGDMKIMIPTVSCRDVGVRAVISEEELSMVFQCLKSDSTEMPSNWNKRYRSNMEKLKTGDAMEVAEVVKNLTRLDAGKRLSSGEKKMLTNAKQMLISEIILIKGIDEVEAVELIEIGIAEGV